MEENLVIGPASVPGEQPPGAATKDEKQTAVLVWLLDVVVPVLGPYLMWKLQAKESRYVEYHAKACVNHSLTVMVLMLAACVVFGGLLWGVTAALEPGDTERGYWTFVVAVAAAVGLLALTVLVLGVVSLILHVVAMLKGAAGEWYEPPMCWRFVK